MKKILFSIFSAFMVSTMASAQYVNVKMDDGTYSSFKTSSKTEVDFGEKKGAELAPSGYYSKEEVDAMLKEIKDVLLGYMTVDDAKDYFFENGSDCVLNMFRHHEASSKENQQWIEEICFLLTNSHDTRKLYDYCDHFPYGVSDYLLNLCRLLTGSSGPQSIDYYQNQYPFGVLDYLKSGVRSQAETTSIPANAETASPDEILEENKFLKNKIAELEKRLEALEAK